MEDESSLFSKMGLVTAHQIPLPIISIKMSGKISERKTGHLILLTSNHLLLKLSVIMNQSNSPNIRNKFIMPVFIGNVLLEKSMKGFSEHFGLKYD